MKAGFHHSKSDINRLYFSCKDGDGGMIGIFDCFRQEMTALATYLETTKDDSLVKNRERREKEIKTWNNIVSKRREKRNNKSLQKIERNK